MWYLHTFWKVLLVRCVFPQGSDLLVAVGDSFGKQSSLLGNA